jgi:hypothetical protein
VEVETETKGRQLKQPQATAAQPAKKIASDTKTAIVLAPKVPDPNKVAPKKAFLVKTDLKKPKSKLKLRKGGKSKKLRCLSEFGVDVPPDEDTARLDASDSWRPTAKS